MSLEHFIAANRDEIIARCQDDGAARSLTHPVHRESAQGIPLFLDQLGAVLHQGPGANLDIGLSAVHHGHDLLLRGFTVSQVVHAYGDVCQAITGLAVDKNAPISAVDFGTLNRCLDDAIANAVTEYGRHRDQSTADDARARHGERLGFLAHEVRNLVNTAILAFEVLKTGNVGIAGRVGSVLHRSLIGLEALIARSLDEVRLTQGIESHERLVVSDFIKDVGAAGALEANAKGLRFVVLPVDDGVIISADREVLAAVVKNLLQNAFKFTRPRSLVTLRVRAAADRVLMEIEDECGGLPGERSEDLFRPFEQRGPDRTGVGLGLAFSRWAVEANHGRIYARSLARRGCVFTVDLPRVDVPQDAMV